MTDTPLLFSPIAIRSLKARNRIVISPMCQYSAVDGLLNDWHLVHLGQFAIGGAGIVLTEATAVEERGRITHGDTGLWNDAQIEPFRRVVSFVKSQGAAVGIQLAHAGRKASMQRPWFGNGPLGEEDFARGDQPWEIVAPSPIPVDDGWIVPKELPASEIPDLVENFASAAKRALTAGADTIEIHGAHGYLIASFLSAASNRRNDRYGGDRSGRMRLALEITEAVRGVWPEDRPLFFRISAVDGSGHGWTLEDSVVLGKELKRLGVDVMDCSSGGIAGSATAAGQKRQPGFQVPFSETIRLDVGIMTQAVGLITHPLQAEEILEAGQADLIAIGREALNDTHWPLRAASALDVGTPYAQWPSQYGWWLAGRDKTSEFYRPDSGD